MAAFTSIIDSVITRTFTTVQLSLAILESA
jgi:hypothetical protein